MACGDSKLHLIVSPFLRPEDRAAGDDGPKSSEIVAAERLAYLSAIEEMLVRHTLRCLAYLLRAGHIEIRIAILEDALFNRLSIKGVPSRDGDAKRASAAWRWRPVPARSSPQ